MAKEIYRKIMPKFWTDPKVDDDFTPEDKYFYLYLMTNPHTNICGCYEISVKQMARETGYNEDTINRLLKRMIEVHKVIDYSYETHEVLLINWYKYNWTKSDNLLTGVENVSQHIKNERFSSYIQDLINGIERVYRRSTDRMQTSDSVSVSVSDSVSDSVSVNKKGGERFFPDDKLNSAFKDYVDFRKKIKKPMTDRAIELALIELAKLSNGDNDKAIEILNQSILRGWTGLFELKADKQQKGIDWDKL